MLRPQIELAAACASLVAHFGPPSAHTARGSTDDEQRDLYHLLIQAGASANVVDRTTRHILLDVDHLSGEACRNSIRQRT
jgi:hypothetical protein